MSLVPRRLAPLAIAAVLGLAAAPPTRAQDAKPTVVRVRVTDTTRAPLPGVSLVILKDSNETVLFAQTNVDGRAQFVFAADSGHYRLIIRKVGFLETRRAIHPNTGDTVTVALALAPLPHQLDTVRVMAQRESKWENPYIDADEIARSGKTLLSLGEVIGKLRIGLDRASIHKCLLDSNWMPLDSPIIRPPANPMYKPPVESRLYINGRRIPPEWNPWYLIRAQDIAELRFVDCWDHSIADLPAEPWPAVYVILKPGIVIERGAATHPATDTTAR